MVLGYVLYIRQTLPDPGSIASRRVGESTKIYDSTGQVVLYDIYGEEKRTIIPWEEIPESVKKATLASEDDDFYRHKGIDFLGVARAVWRNILSLDIEQGGSTITQQLVGNALVGRQQTWGRKIQEAILAIEVERQFSKDEILWMYLNQIPYGSNAYGIESAANTFFGKSAKDLTINEAAILASLTKSTTYYSPYGNHVDVLMNVKNGVLKRMLDLRFISQDEYDTALNDTVVFERATEKIQAPHFVIMVREYLVDKYGEETIQNGGLKIITTLDHELQKIAEEVVEKYGAINEQRYRARNAALTAVEPSSGKILAMVGSRDYFNQEIDGNYNVAMARRQPGSSFKPFAYATAFKKGFPDSTILFDYPTEFNPNCPPTANGVKDIYGLACYNPQNYDGSYRGPVTMRQSLAMSLNVPSVMTLYLAGVQDTANLAEDLGITTLEDRQRFGLSLVLGGAEVRLTDMVSAYGVFSNDGTKNPWYFIDRIELPNGNLLEEHRPDPQRVLDSQTSRLVTDILSDNNARAPVFGFSNSLYIPGIELAAKTGTTQENKDAWVVGYTTAIAAGVWTGNNDNKPMSAAGAGISAAGPMWNEFMRRAANTYTPGRFPEPEPVFSTKPLLDGQYNNSGFGIHSVLYFVDTKNPQGPIPNQPQLDPQFNNWEWPISQRFGSVPASSSL